MNKSKLSFFLIADKIQDWNFVLREVTRLNPPSIGVMNDLQRAIEVQNAIDGDVLYSIWNSDPSFWRTKTPENYIQDMRYWQSQGFHGIVDVYREHWQQDDGFIAHNEAILRRATDAGIRVAWGGFAVASYTPDQIYAGMFDRCLQLASEGGHVLSVHEYAPFGTFAGLNFMPHDWFYEQWDTNNPAWTPQNFNHGDYFRVSKKLWIEPNNPHWQEQNTAYYRRCEHFHRRAVHTLGLPPPEIYVTEFGIDSIDQTKQAREWLEAKIGIANASGGRRYLTMRGAQTLRKVWREWFPDWDFDTAFLEQMAYADHVYQASEAHINALHYFCITSNWDEWNHLYGFDIADRQQLISAYVDLALSSQSEPETETATPIPEIETLNEDEMTLWDIYPIESSTNYRTEPRVANETLAGKVTQHNPLRAVQLLGFANGDGYKWIQFRTDNQVRYITTKHARMESHQPVSKDGNTIDMRDYIFGRKDATFAVEFHNKNNGAKGHELVFWTFEGNYAFRQKNGNYEQWYTGVHKGEEWFYRGVDTSPDAHHFYAVWRDREGGTFGAKWLPRYVEIGKRYNAHAFTQFYVKNNCAKSDNRTGQRDDEIVVVQHHPTYTTETGLVFQDCMELHGWFAGAHRETWICSRDFGYFIEWKNVEHNLVSSVTNPNVSHTDRHHHPRLRLQCEGSMFPATPAGYQAWSDTPQPPVEPVPAPPPNPTPEWDIAEIKRQLQIIRDSADQMLEALE